MATFHLVIWTIVLVAALFGGPSEDC